MEIFDAIGIYLQRVVGQLIMFFATGILFEFVLEWIKAGWRSKTGKPVPKWGGIMLGIAVSILYIASAYWASVIATTSGWEIPGSPVFLYVWFWLFFFWQYGCIHIAKPIFKKLLPFVYYENYVKPAKEKSKDSIKDILGISEEELSSLLADAIKKKDESAREEA